ncbi:MAG: hypothetical protein AAGF78_07920 [Pseudomonadota bacterium]
MAERKEPSVEFLRYVGAGGIVWFHLSGPVAWIGYAALAIFIVLSVVFALQGGVAWSRRRVLHLWVFWSLVYGALKALQAVMTSQPLASEFDWWMLLTGPSLPLWFLPFIFVACGLAVSFDRHVKLSPALEGTFCGLASAAFVVAEPMMPIPLAQWCIGLAAVAAAIPVYRATQGSWIGLVLWSVPILVIQEELLLLAIPVVTLALMSRIETSASWPALLGRLALPVYVLHSGVSAITGLEETPLAIVTVLLISTLLGLVLMRVPLVRRYV